MEDISQQTFVPATFPTWPPPSGGYPVTTPELGPVAVAPYGSNQTGTIITGKVYPPFLGNTYPKSQGTALIGQNQYQLNPSGRNTEVGPIAASTSYSQPPPAPVMGPTPTGP